MYTLLYWKLGNMIKLGEELIACCTDQYEFIDGFNKISSLLARDPRIFAPTQENQNNLRRFLGDIDDVIAMCELVKNFCPVSRIGNTGKCGKARVTDKLRIGTSINN